MNIFCFLGDHEWERETDPIYEDGIYVGSIKTCRICGKKKRRALPTELIVLQLLKKK